MALASAATAPQLCRLDLSGNDFSLAGETMVQGLSRLRPRLTLVVGVEGSEEASSGAADGFVYDKARRPRFEELWTGRHLLTQSAWG